MDKTKQKIEEVVKNYITLFGEEFELFKKAQKLRVDSADNFSTVKGSQMIERQLYEIPETLYSMLISILDDEDRNWLESKVGASWFAKKFIPFRSSTKV